MFKFYEKTTSLEGNSPLIQHLNNCWDDGWQAFRVSPNSWYQPIEEDMYCITRLSRKGEDWTQFHELPIDIATHTHMVYVQRYINPQIVEPIYFQVVGGQLCIDSFCREESRCLSLFVMALENYTFGGQHCGFSLIYYVDGLLTRTQQIRWLMILLRQFCFSQDRFCLVFDGRLFFQFTSKLYTLFFERFHATRLALPHGLPLRHSPLMHVCASGGSYYPRGSHQSGCVEQLEETFVISRLEWMILSLVLYYTYTRVCIGKDV